MKKYIVALIIAIILIGVMAAYTNNLVIKDISGLVFSYKILYISIIIILILFLISLIGIPSYIIYLIIDLFMLGQLIYLFAISYSYKGLIYLSVYFIFFKIPIYFLLILNSFYTIKYSKNLYRFLFNRFGQSIRNIKLYFKKILVICMISYIYIAISTLIGKKVMGILANYLFF